MGHPYSCPLMHGKEQQQVLKKYVTATEIELLAAQRHHGVDGECSARGNQAGACRDQNE
jgi:hypothetical protein